MPVRRAAPYYPFAPFPGRDFTVHGIFAVTGLFGELGDEDEAGHAFLRFSSLLAIISAQFARTSAAASGGQTLLPHMRT